MRAPVNLNDPSLTNQQRVSSLSDYIQQLDLRDGRDDGRVNKETYLQALSVLSRRENASAYDRLMVPVLQFLAEKIGPESISIERIENQIAGLGGSVPDLRGLAQIATGRNA